MTITEIAPVSARDSPSPDIAPTQNIDAEQSVLGSMLLSPNAIDDVTDVLGPDDFYRPIHTTIYQAIINAYAAGQPTDHLAIAGRLLSSGDLVRTGGAPYLHDLIASVPVSASAGYHARVIAECAGRRRLAAVAATISQTATNPALTLADAQDRAGEALSKATAGKDDESTSRVGDLFDDAFRGIEAAAARTGIRGISTGIVDLDKLTSGFQPGQLIVVAGRPGMGKSTAALDFLRITSLRDGLPGLYFSLEMPKLEVVNRILSAETGIPYYRIRDGALSEDEWIRLARKTGEIAACPMFVDDGNLNLAQMRSRGRRIKQRHGGISEIVVDYIQLSPSTTTGRDANREQEVAALTRGLKLLGKELECPVIAVSQLNRGPEQRQDKRPNLADLRESGAIEQDADIVIFVHRDDYYDKESPRAGEADFIVAKNRGGALDTVSVISQLHCMRFADYNINAI